MLKQATKERNLRRLIYRVAFTAAFVSLTAIFVYMAVASMSLAWQALF